MYKLLIFVVFTCCFALQAQNVDPKDNAQSSAKSVIIEDEEDVLVNEEDEVLLKANSTNKKDSDSGSTAESSNVGDEEKLILDGDEEELLVEEEPAVTTEDSLKSASSVQETSDSLALQAEGASEDSSVEAPRQRYTPAPETQKITRSIESGVVIPSPKDGIKLDTISPIKIEKTQSINFAENASKYRSPKLAMLMSFLVPGTGQAYAKRGWRAGVYGAAEVAIIAVGATLSVKGKNAKNDAKKFANIHYSYDTFDKYYQNLGRHIGNDTILNELFNSYGVVDTFKTYSQKKNDDYYSGLKDVTSPYVQGWDDVNPTFDSDFKVAQPGYSQRSDSLYLVYTGTDSTNSRFGFSKNQEKFRDMMHESNSKYSAAKVVFALLLVNHVVSAFDAVLMTKAYNDKLLGKQSFWHNVNIKEQQIATASGLMNGYAVQVRF